MYFHILYHFSEFVVDGRDYGIRSTSRKGIGIV